MRAKEVAKLLANRINQEHYILSLMRKLVVAVKKNCHCDKTCEWTYEEEFWDTECGNCFVIMDGTPSENKMKYCCYCGGQINELKGGGK